MSGCSRLKTYVLIYVRNVQTTRPWKFLSPRPPNIGDPGVWPSRSRLCVQGLLRAILDQSTQDLTTSRPNIEYWQDENNWRTILQVAIALASSSHVL